MFSELTGIFSDLLPGVYLATAGTLLSVIVLGIKLGTEKSERKSEMETERLDRQKELQIKNLELEARLKETVNSTFVDQNKKCGRLFSEIDRKQENLDKAVKTISDVTIRLEEAIKYFKKNGNGNGGVK